MKAREWEALTRCGNGKMRYDRIDCVGKVSHREASLAFSKALDLHGLDRIVLRVLPWKEVK